VCSVTGLLSKEDALWWHHHSELSRGSHDSTSILKASFSLHHRQKTYM
jgi:hypothetical protein